MAVLASKSEPLCKLCKHPKRAEIDAILELRSNYTRGDDLPDGKKGPLLWTAEKVIEQLVEWGVHNPHIGNLKVHWKRHCTVVSEQSIIQAQSATLVKLDELRSGGRHADPDEVLRLIITVFNEELLEKIARGDRSGVTGDLAMKAQAELTKRQHSETQNELLTLFGQATASAIKAIADPRAVRQIEGAEVIDAEYVEVEVEVES